MATETQTQSQPQQRHDLSDEENIYDYDDYDANESDQRPTAPKEQGPKAFSDDVSRRQRQQRLKPQKQAQQPTKQPPQPQPQRPQQPRQAQPQQQQQQQQQGQQARLQQGPQQRAQQSQQMGQRGIPQQQLQQGVQGPFGRFRGESLNYSTNVSSTNQMPTTIKGLFENIPLEAMMIENWVRKRLVLVGDNQPLDKALQRLNRHKITSLPIINEQTGNIKGILDSLDIVNYLSTVLDQEAIGPARWDFNLKNTGQLLDMSRNRGSVMSNQSNVYEALKVLAKGEPRVMVIDASCNVHIQEKEEENILGLFTQSDIVRFLGANPYWLKLFPDSCKKLSELGIVGNNNEQVITVEQNTPAYEAFKKIAEASTSGVAVVDGQGRIVAHLSASNIRGISRRNFQLLRRPLFEFLQRDRRRGWWTMPVCLNEGDTLEKAVLQFGSTRVHQMYVCDTEGKPKHVVNLTDIVRQFVSTDDQPRSA